MRLIGCAVLLSVLSSGTVFAQCNTTTTTTLSVSPSGTAQFGQAVTLTAIVRAGSCGVSDAPVAFYSGTTMLGVGTVMASQATLTTSLLPVGSNSLTAYFPPNGELSSSRSSPVVLSVNAVAGNGFRTPAIESGGTLPNGVVVGDFNNDGIPDFAVANNNSSDVTVMIGNGSGGFTAASGSPYSAGGADTGARGVAVGDFNGDGWIDIAVANYSTGTVSILLNSTFSPGGTVTFDAAVNYSTGVSTTANGIAVADFNNDGYADLAVTNYGSTGTVAILLGTGSGTFPTVHTTVSVAASPGAIAIGDFNGDGNADFVVSAFGSNSIDVRLGDGTGAFTVPLGSPYAINAGSSSPYSVAVGDFNGDGIPDLATVNFGSNDVSVFEGNGSGGIGNGTFTLFSGGPWAAGSGAEGIALGDFNGDGKLDIATVNGYANNVSVLLGTGSGSFAAATTASIGTGTTPFALAVADFNGDGVADIVTANSGTNNESVMLGLVATAMSLISISPADATLGSSVTISGSVAPGASAGDTISFYAGGSAPVGTYTFTANASPGTFNNFQTTTIPQGLQTITAVYNGNSVYAASAPSNGLQVDNQAGSTTVLSATPNSTAQTVTLTATVTNGATGTVEFQSGGQSLGSMPLSGGSPSTASITVSDPAATSNLTATYTGDTNYSLSVSNRLIATSASLALTSGTNPSAVNQSITFTATIYPQPTGSGTETVLLVDSGTPIGSATVSAGTAVFPPISSLAVGSHSLTAVYAGDTADAGSTSSVVTQTVQTPAATVTTLTAPSSPRFGQEAQLIASISPGPSSAPYGNVTFYDGATVLGTAPVLVVQGSLSATLSTELLSQGKRTIRARYDGVPLYSPSLSAVANPQVVVTSAAQVGFGTELTYSNSGSTPGALGVAINDFNSDGYEDVTVTTFTGGQGAVKVLYGGGNGTLSSDTPTYSIGANTGTPVSVAAADVNGDGMPDLIVLTNLEVVVLLNNGSGFGNPILVSAGALTSLSSLTVADFNGDGIPDLVVGGSGGASILLGKGDGTFASATSIGATLTGAVYVAAGDFNSDGIPDLALADYNEDLNILRGNGDGTFSPLSHYTETNNLLSIAVGDVNNDGNADIVLGANGISFRVLLGTGAGGFGAPASVSVNSGVAALVTVGDFDGDGINDVGVADNQNGGIEVLLSKGDGTFQVPLSYSTPAGTANAIAVGNFANDGHADFAITDGNDVGLLLGSPQFFDFVSVADGTSPLAYFRLENLSGGSETSDYTYSYSAAGATQVSGAPIAVAGNKAASLDGNSGAVTTTLSGGIQTAGSIMAWVNMAALPSTLGRIEYVAGESQVGNDFDVQFTTNGSGNNVLGFYTTTSGQYLSYTPLAATLLGNWHLIVATFDAEAGTRAIYWDGALVASDNVESLTDKTADFEIGASSVFAGRNFEGSIDEVAVWNYALTPLQVTQIYYTPLNVLPNGAVNQPYGGESGLALTATGGSGDFNWSETGLPSGLSLSSGQIAGTPAASGYSSAGLTVTDLETNRTWSGTYSLAVGPLPSLTLLSVFPNPAPPGQGVTLTASVSATAPQTAIPSGSIQFFDSSIPLGTAVLNSGMASLTTGVVSGGAHSISAHYAGDTNFEAGISANQPLTVAWPPLSITTTSLPSGVAGQSYSAGLSASGGSGNYIWSASGLPRTLGLSASGSISGTPTTAFNGQIYFTVTDATAGLSLSSYLTLTIAAPPLVISGNGNLGDVPVGSSVAASFSATGGVPPYKWALSGATGLSVDGSGNVRGSAGQAGSFTPTLTVTDSVNTSSSINLSLLVLGLTSSFPAGTTTSSYSASVTGVGGAPPYSYSASGVPAGLTFSAGTLSGQEQTPGTYTIGVVVTDHNGTSVSGNYSFTITGPAPVTLSITTSSLPNGFVGQPYSQTLGAAGGAPGYTWTQSGGQMPAGLSLSSGGTIGGTPTATGSFTIGVQVADTSGAQVVSTVSLNILPAPLGITSGATFPDGLAGVPYPSQILTASGGVAPYTFSVQGSLPAGLTLSNGQIGGTPTATGGYSITVVVTDSAAVPNTASLAVGMNVDPNAPNLVLAGATASFALTSATTSVPSPATIAVTSSVVAQILAFTATSSVPWLTVGGSATTPGSITVGPNSSALALSATGSPYTGTVTVTCASDACSGSTQTITVTLTVTALPPQLSVGSPLLSFVALTSNPQSSSEALSIVNAGGGSLTITAVTAGSSWISVGAFPATVAPGPGGSVTITANPAALNPGYYLSSVTVASSAGSTTVPVTLLLSASSVMTLGPAGTQFSMPQGGALGNPGGSFLVSVSSGSVSYSATVLPGASWLSGGGSGTATPSNPGTVSFAIDPVAAAALPVGAYYGTLNVTGPGIVNAPQAFQVVLSVSAAATTLTPNPEPAGLVFISSGGALPPQIVQLFASSTTGIGYQAAQAVINGSGWLAVSPATGSTSATSPAQVSVTASAAGLAPGIYRGSVSFAFASSAPTVNVTLIVQAPLNTAAVATPALSSGGKPAPAQSGPTCSGGQLVPTQTGLVSNFSAPASWPTPLAITLMDTCGNAIGNGQVVATFSNGDPPLILAPIDTSTGLYSGTWTPRNTSSQVTILARASVPGYTTATTQIAGRVAPNTAPSLNPNGTSDIFHPQVGAGLGPGNIVQIYGSGLAGQPGSPAVLPLPKQVNGTSVLIGGVEAPLYYVSPSQVNAQIPFELTAGSQYQVIVNANGALTTPQPIQLTQAVPAILQFTSGAVVAQHQDGTLISDTAPAAPGEYITIYLSGLGATNPPVASGVASPSNPPATVVDTPVLTLNTTTIPVSFAGLAPGFVGLYQINFQVPEPLADGNYELLITQSGVVSNQTVLQVSN